MIVQLNRNKNIASVTIGFYVYDGFRISGKVSDSVGFGCGFGIRHIPSRRHNLILSTKNYSIVERDFIAWMLYKDAY